MARTVNERMRDRALAHVINLHRFSNAEVRAMLALLAQTDILLYSRLQTALERLPSTSFTVKRLDSVLSGVWSLNERAYRQLNARSERDLRELVAAELAFNADTFRALLPEGSPRVGVPGEAQVWAATVARPFRGRLMSEWYATLGQQRQRRISDALRIGYVRGATISEMIQELRGTRAANYSDGILNIAESQAALSISGTAQDAEPGTGANKAVGRSLSLALNGKTYTGITVQADGDRKSVV